MTSAEVVNHSIIDLKQRDFVLAKAHELCAQNGAKLLYLTLFGSTLYGTRIPGKSDLDVKGLFLPTPELLALGESPRNLRFSTGDGKSINTPEDIDIDLWSLQYWLQKLLPAGDTGAQDLLFSPSHEACVLYRNIALDSVFSSPLRLINTVEGRTYAEYSLRQAKKYGIKGSRLGALRAVSRFLKKNAAAWRPHERLAEHSQLILSACSDGRFCTLHEKNGQPMLLLCGKLHTGELTMQEFQFRVEKEMERYGARAHAAERNEGLDFKALSHAMRTVIQMNELLTTGTVRFPLKERSELIAIKEGNLTWGWIEGRILEGISAVDSLRENTPYRGIPDPEFAKSCLLSCYGLHLPKAATPGARRNVFAEGFDVHPETLDAIHDRLDKVEAQHGVKILYACESGSRGWNFASKDSDFDIRFIYIHDANWYLSVAPEEKEDTVNLKLERTPAGELDIGGWEIRKALKLFRRSNAPLMEWLSSPLIYREDGPMARRLRALAPLSFSSAALWHHYRGLMEKSRTRFQTETPSIKTWFYMLRPLLCMCWLEMEQIGQGPPPMRFDLIVRRVIRDTAVSDEIQRLVCLKREGIELENFTPSRLLSNYTEELFQERPVSPTLPAARKKVDLDEVFREALNCAR